MELCIIFRPLMMLKSKSFVQENVLFFLLHLISSVLHSDQHQMF